jgi:hypothetical protein
MRKKFAAMVLQDSIVFAVILVSSELALPIMNSDSLQDVASPVQPWPTIVA